MTETDRTDSTDLRPWQLDPTGAVDEDCVDDWIRHLERVRRTPQTAGTTSSSEGDPAASALGVSAVVTLRAGGDVESCLRSIADQTLARTCFEVVLVVDGGVQGLDPVVDGFHESEPDLTLRVVELSHAGVLCLRDVGVSAARGRYIAFLDAHDRISPRYLETLLEHADDHTVTVAYTVGVDGVADTASPSGGVADTASASGEVADTASASSEVMEEVSDAGDDAESGASSGTGEKPSGAGDPAEPSLHTALATAAGTLVPAALAKAVEHDTTPRTRHDVLFFMTMLAAYDCDVCLASASDDAVYFRSARPAAAACAEVPDFDEDIAVRMDLIAQLDALAHDAEPETRDLLHGLVDAEVDEINGFLRAHPAARDRVVEVLDHHDLEYFPYDRLNAGFARALAVAYCFAPYNDSSAVVMAKRVRERRDVVDVVYNAMDKNRDLDPSMRRISGPYVETELAVDTPTYFSNWAAIEAFCVQGLERISSLERAKGPYERLYSRVMWPASHFLAAAYKLRNPSVEWIAEFSDPAARDVAGAERSSPIAPGPFLDLLRSELARKNVPALSSRNCLDWCEYLAYACADQIVFTNENQRDYMLGYFGIPEIAEAVRAKAVISPHPTLPPAFYSMADHAYLLDPSVVNIAYFGTFYATRGLGDVLAALADVEGADRDRLRLHVFTNNTDDLQRHVDEAGLAEQVRVNPYVRFLAFLNLATKFDCLIVNDALTADSHDRNPYLPSKWSDYKGSGRSVWGLVEDGSPMSGQDLDHASPVGDIEAAKEVLRRLAAGLPAPTAATQAAEPAVAPKSKSPGPSTRTKAATAAKATTRRPRAAKTTARKASGPPATDG